MPLRDHFANPDHPTWQPVLGGWPMVIIQHLIRRLPPRYQVHPKIHVGTFFEIDIGTIDTEPDVGFGNWGGGGGTATQALPETAVDLEVDGEVPSEYEVNITDREGGKLVAVIELVSPSNKDRPDNRRDFVAKCEAFVNRGVCVTVVDLVTYRDFNLYTELLTDLGHTDPTMSADPPQTYAATVRKRWLTRTRSKFETWSAPMAVGQPLPMLPVWVSETHWVPLELEATYEETCQTLRLR
jgi:hypothetical protein